MSEEIGHGPLRDREPPERFKQGKGMCFQKIALSAERRMEQRQHTEASLCTLPFGLRACGVLVSGIVFFAVGLISMPL